MKLFIMTDLEGVAGVINGVDYLYHHSRYYETARRLLTDEVNAAIEGFIAGGFDDILVADGHGAGAINIERLDPRVRLARGWGEGTYPFGLTRDFDAMAYVGQHAKAGTPLSHLTHTGWWSLRDQTINGVSVGEYGEGALCAGELGVPVIFGCGEKAFCNEVADLTPWVVTCSVLEGVIDGSGDDLTREQYERFHEGAVHLHPKAACKLIRATAEDAATRFAADRDAFKPLTFDPPYHIVRHIRASADGEARSAEATHDDSVIELLRNKPR